MRQINEVKKVNVRDLSKEELQNTYGGAWWEVRIEDGKIVWIFHPYDYDK